MTEMDPFRESTGLYVLGALPPDERAAFEAHLRTCADCAAEVRALQPMVDAISHGVVSVDPPSDLRRRVLAAAATARTPVVPAAEPARQVPSIATPRTGSVLTWSGWLAAAASLAAAVWFSSQATTARGQLERAEAELTQAVNRLQASQQQLQASVRETDSVRASLALLSAPDSIELRLAGQPPAAAARGRAFLSRSRGLLFAATSLPAIPTDRTYQLWYLTPGAPVSAGLLSPDAQGNVTVSFDAVDAAQAATGMAVSLEPAGGVPAPTGALYLVSQ